MSVLDWMVDSDPSIGWQVLRDVVDAPAEVVAERARGHRGWGAGFLLVPWVTNQVVRATLSPGAFLEPLSAQENTT